MMITDIRAKFLEFFREKGHAILPSAPLIPENDPTVLFTTAGVHPLVPYLMGQSHPMGTRLANCQKCLRTVDIDEVGDNRHLTFFEMLGNWSLGDYFKEEAIAWSFEFLTDPKWLGLDPSRLYITVFAGDDDAPRDEESIGIWQAQFEVVGIVADVGERIFVYPKAKNWWPGPMTKGLCGPDTEMFYDTGREHDQAFGEACHPNCDCGRFVEIWNNVFMQFNRIEEGGKLVELPTKNVDTGMGLERIAAVVNGVSTVFDLPEFHALMDDVLSAATVAARNSGLGTRSARIIADHIRAAVFVIGDPNGVSPSNVGQGYIVRRLLRRAIREGHKLGITKSFLAKLAQTVIGQFGAPYPELETNRDRIVRDIALEEDKFAKTIEKGMKELEKMMSNGVVTGEQAFVLFSTYGFPLELTEEILQEKDATVDRIAFADEFKKHQELSRTASAGAFAGGLADHSVETTRLHTATHLLHRALKNVLGDHVEQKGSNITAERLRFDFSHGKKMTPDELAEVEKIVNDTIRRDLPVRFDVMSMVEAKKSGALGYFEDKYAQLGGKIKVYTVGDEDRGYFSKEICGGPHVDRTGELGSFKIQKEEAVSAGVRRIKATVSGG